MHFLNAVVTTCLVLALALPAMAITKPSTPACVANSKKVYSSLPESFQLILLAIDNDGKIDLQASNPVIDYDYYNSAWSHIKTLIFEPANLAASAFSLKNKKLIVYGNEAALMPQPFDVHSVGLETPAFNSSTIPGSVPINFTAVPACDSYGRGFLRLTEAGEFLTRNSTRVMRYHN